MKIFPITRERYFGFVKANAKRTRAKAERTARMAKSWPQQFTPFSSDRKNIDSCVLGNAIPKSGTYLLNKIVECLGQWENLSSPEGIRFHI